jgi:serine protease
MVTPFTAIDRQTGAVLRVFPPREVVASLRRTQATSSTNLVYGGGPVQTAPHLYVVYWGATWLTTGDPSGVRARLEAFYPAIGGHAWLNSVTQYTQSDGSHAGNAGNVFSGSYVDSSSSPLPVVTQSQLAAEAAKAAAHFGDTTASAAYVVVTPHNVTTPGFMVQFCAYHSTTAAANGATIAWTALPYMPDAGTSCGQGSVNTPGTLDGVTIVAGHEQGETETDPQPSTGWVDASGSENGDKCAWTGLANNANAGGYPTQPLWSNATASCVQSY